MNTLQKISIQITSNWFSEQKQFYKFCGTTYLKTEDAIKIIINMLRFVLKCYFESMFVHACTYTHTYFQKIYEGIGLKVSLTLI